MLYPLRTWAAMILPNFLFHVTLSSISAISILLPSVSPSIHINASDRYPPHNLSLLLLICPALSYLSCPQYTLWGLSFPYLLPYVFKKFQLTLSDFVLFLIIFFKTSLLLTPLFIEFSGSIYRNKFSSFLFIYGSGYQNFSPGHIFRIKICT